MPVLLKLSLCVPLLEAGFENLSMRPTENVQSIFLLRLLWQ